MSRVTWLVAVKNGMPYLTETLASIEEQTYRDWEVLAWDNGSTDGTVEELQRWIPARLPGQVVADQPFRSLGACRAAMVERAATEYCACIDADDINLPQRLRKQVAFLDAHPDIDVVGSLMNRIDAEGHNYGMFYPYPQEHNDIVHAMLCDNPLAQPTVLFRCKAVLEAGNYRDVGEINIEDYDLWLRVAMHHKLANVQECLVNYRVHPKSTTQIALAQNRLMSAMTFRFCEHAPRLFGCSTRDAELLRQRQHPCADRVLRQIATYLQRSQGGTVRGRLKSDSFLHSARQLVGDRDLKSRWAIALWSGYWRSLIRGANLMAKLAARK